MSSIDNRVVQMTFDNASFERKLEGTLKSLDALTKSLDFANSQKSLGDLGKMAGKFDMSGMSSAVDGVSAKFVALSTIAIAALATITRRAVDAGIDLAKSLSLDQIIGGFREYETNMNSIQTVLANTKKDGTTLQDVNQALDQLNTYADKTIYNFAQMARNIGTFTAAGVDLDTSVQSIKGIANLAAISGSNSQQASTAMYQLSQAISSGTVRLMDWNSVVNAGMGGEVFQEALFEAGKALGTIEGVPIEQTFDDWTAAGNTFRSSLESNWLTADVLTTTLQGFTGEMTEAQLTAKGFTVEQAQRIIELGETGVDAATKVRTLTQLISTAQEAVGSGWSQSFRIMFGDFEEATDLFTSISSAMDGMIGSSAEARNELLQGWKDMGGRDVAIWAFRDALKALGEILAPIKEAFREIFPKKTSEDLLLMTVHFWRFAKALSPSAKTVDILKRSFKGFFSAIQLGWEIVKGFINLFKDLAGELFGAGEGVGEYAAKVGDFFTALNDYLLEGGRLRDFFDDLAYAIRHPKEALEKLKERLSLFFEKLKSAKIKDSPISGFLEKIQERLGTLEKVFNRTKEIFQGVGGKIAGLVSTAFSGVFDTVSGWATKLKENLKGIFTEGDFKPLMDILNIGILGAMTAFVLSFTKHGFFRKAGTFIDNIGDAFEELTDVLSAMQADLRANALLKLALAIGVLTASVIVLSTIDSQALTKSLTAMAIGFGQLVGVMTMMSKMSLGVGGSVSAVAVAAGLVIVAGAVFMLSLAVRSFAKLDWNELAKGLTAVTVLLVVLGQATKALSTNSPGMIRAGIGLIGIAIAMNLLAVSMKIFATMSWEDMGKGLVGVAGGLAAITAAMNLLPSGMVKKGAGILAVALAMNLLAVSMKIFATMSWEDMSKGLVGVGGGLLLIAGAMQLMPKGLLTKSAGILVVAVALNAIAHAVGSMAGLSWEELGRGIAGLAGALLVLGVAMTAMGGSIFGAVAIGITAVSMLALAKAVEMFGRLDLKDTAKGLLVLAGTLAVLGLGAYILGPLVPTMFALGLAMSALGLGMALFGFGASLAVSAFVIFVGTFNDASELIFTMVNGLLDVLPAVVKAFVAALLGFVQALLDSAGPLISALTEIIKQLLQSLTDLAPSLAEAATALILAFLDTLRETFPTIVTVGFEMLLALLNGLRDNISEITTVAIDILLAFLEAIGSRMGEITASAVELLVTFLTSLSDNIEDVVAAGVELVAAFIQGVVSNIGVVVTAAFDLLIAFLDEIANNIQRVIDTGADMVVSFIEGVSNNLQKVIDAGFGLVTDFVTGMGNNIGAVIDAAVDAIVAFIKRIGEGAQSIITAGKDLIIDFVEGMGNAAGDVVAAAVETIVTFTQAIADNLNYLVAAGFDIVISLMNGIADTIDEKRGEFYAAGKRMAWAIVDGMSFGIASRVKGIVDRTLDVGAAIERAGRQSLEIESPSKKFIAIGEHVVAGLAAGLSNTAPATDAVHSMANDVQSNFQRSMTALTDSMKHMDEFEGPIITPVLNLEQFKKDARKIGTISGSGSFAAGLSYSHAREIAATRINSELDSESAAAAGAREVKFEQNIYSPTQLSTNDIYRQTRNQITLVKEELKSL